MIEVKQIPREASYEPGPRPRASDLVMPNTVAAAPSASSSGCLVFKLAAVAVCKNWAVESSDRVPLFDTLETASRGTDD